MSTIAERVAAGAAFLDEKQPGWAERINLDQLRLESCFSCVLGQLFGGYGDGVDELHLAPIDEEDVALGFYWSDEDGDDECDDLTAEWKRVITGRRAAS